MTGGDETKEIVQSSDKGQIIMSPYYLHPQDNHGSLISPAQLKEKMIKKGQNR